MSTDAAEPVGQMPWSYCPECGSDEIHHEEGRHKQCARCHQEWFSDLDYTNVVRSNLADKATLQSDLAQAQADLKALGMDYGNLLAQSNQYERERDKLQADLTEAKREKAAAMGLVEGHAITIGKLEADLTEARGILEWALATAGEGDEPAWAGEARALIAKTKGAV